MGERFQMSVFGTFSVNCPAPSLGVLDPLLKKIDPYTEEGCVWSKDNGSNA